MHLIDINMCAGDTIFIENQAYTETDIYEQIVLTENDCDSLVQLDLFVIVCDIEATYTGYTPTCYNDMDGNISFTVQNGTAPFRFIWKNLNDDVFSIPQALDVTSLTAEISNLSTGKYVIEIHDQFGNSEILLVELENPEPMVSDIVGSDFNGFGVLCHDSTDGFLYATVGGGTAPLEVLWSNGLNTARIENLLAGTYI